MEVKYSRRVPKVRIHVEHVIGLLKNRYTILRNTIPVSLLKYENDVHFANIDKILTTCAAVTNL